MDKLSWQWNRSSGMWPLVHGPTLMHTWAALMDLLAMRRKGGGCEAERGVHVGCRGHLRKWGGVNMIMFIVYGHGILEE